MKIAFAVSEPLVPTINGVRNKTFNLSRALRDREQVELDVVSPDDAVEGGRRAARAARVFRWSPQQRYGAALNATELASALTRRNPDVVHIDGLALGVVVLALRDYPYRFRGPIIWSINDSYSRNLSLQVQLKNRNVWRRVVLKAWARQIARFERRVAKSATFVDVVTNQESAWLRSVGVDNSRVVPLGRPAVQYVGRRPDEHFRVGLVTSWAGDYGYAAKEFVTDVWPCVRQRVGPHARLMLPGEVDIDWLQSRRADIGGIEVPGYISSIGQLYSYLDASVVVLPKVGGIQTKALESFCAGVPLISSLELDWVETGSSSTDLPYLLAQSRVALVDALVSLAQSGQARDWIAASGRDFVADWPSWQEVSSRYLEGL